MCRHQRTRARLALIAITSPTVTIASRPYFRSIERTPAAAAESAPRCPPTWAPLAGGSPRNSSAP
eukprot:646841-Pyramimonas_sp.AAC.1